MPKYVVCYEKTVGCNCEIEATNEEELEEKLKIMCEEESDELLETYERAYTEFSSIDGVDEIKTEVDELESRMNDILEE